MRDQEFVSNDEVARAFDGWHDMEDTVLTVNGLAFPKAGRSTPLYAVAFLASRSPGRPSSGVAGCPRDGNGRRQGQAAYLLRQRPMRAAKAPVGTRELLIERFT